MIESWRTPKHELDEALPHGGAPVSTELASPAPERSVLDRHFDLSRISGETLAWGAVLLIALLVRTVGLTNWSLSAGEARIASDALALVQGGSLSPDAATHPLPVNLVAFTIFLFGASDTVVRLIPSSLGMGSILLLLPARAWLGRGPALGAAFALALSPTLVFASRTVGAGSLLVLGSLLLLVALGRSVVRSEFGSMFVLGAVVALLPLAGPLGWVALPLALVIAPALTGRWLPRPKAIPSVVLGFLATILVVSTSLFTRPEGFAGFVNSSLSALWSSHLAAAGAVWFLVPIELVLYELLPLLFGLYAVYLILWDSGRLNPVTERLVHAVVAWVMLAGIAGLLLGGKGPELYCLVVLPLVLLAGTGLSAAAGAVEWRVLLEGRGAWYLVALLLTIVAAASAFGLLLGNPDIDTLRWVMMILVIVVLLLVPLGLITVTIGRGLNGRAGPIAVLVLAVLIAAFGLRSSLLLAATGLDRPGELLLAGSTTPDVRFVVERLQRLSLDLTAMKADVHDPTGGHGLTIAVERSIAEPFTWYLRDFPNVTVVAPDAPSRVPVGHQVIIARPEEGPELAPMDAGYVHRSYDLTVPLASSFDHPPSWTSVAEVLINPRILKQYVDFLFDRELASSAVGPQFDLALRAELAARVYGRSAPSP